MYRSGTILVLSVFFAIFLNASLSAATLDWECPCGVEASCDIHPMIRAIAAAHADCDCSRIADRSCEIHPMLAALLEEYRKKPDQFTQDRWPEHPMIRAVLDAPVSEPPAAGECGCCNSPMIRAIVECWRAAVQSPSGH